NKQFGMLITKLDYYTQALEADDDLIAGLNSLGNNKFVLITESSKNPVKPYTVVEESKTSYRINGAITNIQYSHADWKWIGVGVVITETDEGTEYVYSAHTVEDSARTAAFVASSALNDPTGDYDETETEVLKNYVYKTAAKLSGVSEAEFNGSADKAGYISAYSLELGEGFDTSLKFNKNVEGKEAYLTIGESKTIEAAVVNANGDALDVACSVSVGETMALEVNGTTVKGLKNGYAEVTVTCDLFGYSETVTVYTGSTDAGNMANARVKWYTESTSGVATEGEIDGKPYNFRLYKTGAGSYMYASYSDISVYYIDYLISQGYKYLRVPFYFDTTKYEELGGTAVSKPYITIWVANGLRGTSDGAGKQIDVPENQWCYYDMDLNHYRMNFTRADGSGVDTYGLRNAVISSDRYHYIIMKFSSAYSYVYTGNMTFIKSSGLSIDESNDEIAFGENVNLAEWYGTDETAVFTVDGVKTNEMTAVKAEHAVTIGANVYTAKIGDGSYTVGNTSSWAISYNSVETIEKTMAVKDGLVDGSVSLVDVKDADENVSLGAYTSGDALEELGFEVTHSYVKRYSDGQTQTAETVENTERGIFYVTVSGTKGAQTFSYDVTLDLYSSVEAVEYESFGHSDSKYAVKLYYYAHGALTSKSYDDLVSTYTAESGTGKAMTVGDGYVSLNAYGTDTKRDTVDSAAATVYGNDPTGLVYYVAIDQSKITAEGPIVHEVGNSTTAINVYVTPRHTKEYYEEFAKVNTELLKFSYAAGWSKGQSKRYSLQNIENGKATVSYKDAWSANWQSWAYTNQNVTLQKLVDNYEVFCSNKFPIYISEDPHGRTETDLNNGVAKLSSLIF
ncbi:MAG: hypothetical protein IJB97_08670, partial [Clostridia bacterium]|nr:hypothetical protein [Clostridia bacterium]